MKAMMTHFWTVSWFVLIDDRLAAKSNQFPNTDMVYIHKVSSINKYIDCPYVTTHLGAPSLYSDRFFASAGAVIRSLQSLSRPKKNTLTQQLSMFMKY